MESEREERGKENTLNQASRRVLAAGQSVCRKSAIVFTLAGRFNRGPRNKYSHSLP